LRETAFSNQGPFGSNKLLDCWRDWFRFECAATKMQMATVFRRAGEAHEGRGVDALVGPGFEDFRRPTAAT